MTMNSLRDIGVPLFVMISGALLIGKRESAWTFIKKRLDRVVVPYIFWMFAFILVGHYLLDFGSLKKLIIQTVSINPQGAGVFFWFVPMILTVYVVILIINKLYEKNKHVLGIALIVSLLAVILSNLGFSLDKPMRYVLYALYAVIGYYISKIDLDSFDSRVLAAIFLILSIGLYILEVYINSATSLNLNSSTAFRSFHFWPCFA